MVKKKHFLIVDTETHGVNFKYIYDIAWTIADKKGNILISRNFLVREIFTDPDIMRGIEEKGRIIQPGAYYHAKVYTDYVPMLDDNTVSMLRNWSEIVEQLREDIRVYNVDVISAYNLGFDSGAMRQTSKYLNLGSTVLESPINILDLWLFACMNLFSQRNYKRIADRLEWKSPAGNYRTTAEHAYRYISGNWNFSEAHTALNDTLIETEILADLMRNKRKIPYNVLNPHPWRLAQ